ncbi:MAG: MCE family protein [Prolixibacteraceae bacterium]|nr:MCE family protein [Prolixibacteraceae bacterium]
METHSPHFKIRLGLFVIGGIALLLIALFIIGKQKNLFNPVFKLTTTFYSVSGLEAGSNIRFSGINVGTVDNIEIINDSTVQVDLLIRKDIQQFIKEDCVANIGSAGIIGDRILIISQGSSNSPIVQDGQRIGSNEPIETDDIMASLQLSATSAEIITDQLADIMTKINSGKGTLGRLIHDAKIAQDLSESTLNLKNSSKQIAEILYDINNGEGTLGRIIKDPNIAQDISLTMTNLKNGSKGLDEVIEAAKHNILFSGYFKKKKKETDNESESDKDTHRVEEKNEQVEYDTPLAKELQVLASASPLEMDSIISNLQVTMANAEIISKQLAEIMIQINSGKGTLGMLVQDTALAKVINQTLMNLKSSSKGLDDNMNAAKENFLFKGYYERKAKVAEQKKEDALKDIEKGKKDETNALKDRGKK